VMVYRWQERGGVVLLPRHQGVDLVGWLRDPVYAGGEGFWRAELPNVLTGLHPEQPGWIEEQRQVIRQEWSRLIAALEEVVVERYPKLLNGIGWRVIHRDHACLWTVYAESEPMQVEGLSEQIGGLHGQIEARKLARQWQYPWWGGRTSPTAGSLSTWHPGLKPLDQGGRGECRMSSSSPGGKGWQKAVVWRACFLKMNG
jgi:CRISPR-associated protein Cmr2